MVSSPSSQGGNWHREERAQLLDRLGVARDVAGEVLAYTENPYRAPITSQRWPLADEPHVERWRLYEREARRVGAFDALQAVFPQLRFPIRTNVSHDPAYRAATRRGDFGAAAAFAPGLVLREPAHLELMIAPSAGGCIPIVVAPCRDDFVALVQAFTERNEPRSVPAAMGACLVKGLTNWDRVAAYRTHWEQRQGTTGDEQAWSSELRAFGQRKELYQDRFVLLSSGPYSDVSAEDAGISGQEWLARSLVIRREHELTHYVTWRLFGALRSHAADELVADFIGLVRAFGKYHGELARRFLGLEAYPSFRSGGRLAQYCGEPPLSPRAFAVVAQLVHRATERLETLERAQLDLDDAAGVGRLIHALIGLSLEELAAEDLQERLERRLASPRPT
ncbi:MAG: hypothetical protein GEV06_14110 [Luteitalea sp.]|nr:hypothetical protein [Luteitalea sp.]